MEPSGPSPFLDGDDEVSTPDTMQFVRAPAAVTRQRPPTLRVVAGADLMLHVSLFPGDDGQAMPNAKHTLLRCEAGVSRYEGLHMA